MKIVCMDCQTESYVDVELLKDKKHIECHHCAENIPATSMSDTAEQSSLPSSEDSVFYTDRNYAVAVEIILPQFEEENILEIPETADLPALETDVSLSFEELTPSPSVESISPIQLIEPAQSFALPQTVSARQMPSELSPAVEPAQPLREASNVSQALEGVSSDEASRLKGIKVLTVASPVLFVLVVAFLAFVTLGNLFLTPQGEVRADSGPSAPPVSLPVNEPRQETAAIPSKSNEPALPAPTPQLTESKPAPQMTSPDPPPSVPAQIPAKGQFTIQVGSHNDQAAADAQAEKLKAAGFEPRVVSVDIPKRGRWYRVQTGSFNSREEANRYGAQILAKGAAETFVISGL